LSPLTAHGMNPSTSFSPFRSPLWRIYREIHVSSESVFPLFLRLLLTGLSPLFSSRPNFLALSQFPSSEVSGLPLFFYCLEDSTPQLGSFLSFNQILEPVFAVELFSVFYNGGDV